MLQVLLLSVTLAVALSQHPSSPREPPQFFKDLGQDVKDLGSNVVTMVENVNVNARRSDLKMERVIESVDANTAVLNQILEILNYFKGVMIKDNPHEMDEWTTIPPFRAQGQDCSDALRDFGETRTGYYVISLSKDLQDRIRVYCDMKTDGGGWTVIQRRGNFSNKEQYFSRTWREYKDGFGELDGEFWLGNEKIFEMTNQKSYELRVDLWDLEGEHKSAVYSDFSLNNEQDMYRINIGKYSGDAGDSMSGQNDGRVFLTKDRDPNYICSDRKGGSGGWWFAEGCGWSNLNGEHLGEDGDARKGILWFSFKKSNAYSLSATEMKIRPKGFLV